MSVEGYAEFLRRIGHTVRSSGGHYWFNSQRGMYQSFPVDSLVDPRGIGLADILGRDGWMARYPCCVSLGKRSFRLACDPSNYGLHRLSGKARNQTRRGLERCEIHPVDPKTLRTRGLDINVDTLERQGRAVSASTTDYWRRYFNEVSDAEGSEVWGAYAGNELAAFLIAFRMRDCAHIFIMRSARGLLAAYPNNALLFRYITLLAADSTIRDVSIGLEPIQPDLESLNHFKYGMGFQEVPVGQRIDLAPWLRPFANSAVSNWVAGLVKFSGSDTGKKIHAVITWYHNQPRLDTPGDGPSSSHDRA